MADSATPQGTAPAKVYYTNLRSMIEHGEKIGLGTSKYELIEAR